jgi:hypothetical protein
LDLCEPYEVIRLATPGDLRMASKRAKAGARGIDQDMIEEAQGEAGMGGVG